MNAAPRPTLRSFLEHADSRTGERLESAALAEMAGYTVADAEADGWRDIFAAASSMPVRIDERIPPSRVDDSSATRAFIRGLAYTAPVIALWALFPAPVSHVEVRYLAMAVVLSWGGSMATNHVVGSWMWGSPRSAWRFALAAMTVAALVATLVGQVWVLVGAIGEQAALLGVLQVVYFFAAGPLMLRRERAGLYLLAFVGALAGFLILVEPWPAVLWQWSGTGDLLRVVAGACLAGPAVILVRQVIAVRSARSGVRSQLVGRDVLAYGTYGVCFGCLTLWGPVVVPDSVITLLTLVIVAGIAFAEMAVALVRQRIDHLLDQQYDPAEFARRARWIVLSGVAAYLLPVGLGVGIAFGISNSPETTLVRCLAVVAVIGLGGVQVFSLLGMALHGIRWVAAAQATCATALLLATARMQDIGGLVLAYVIVIVILWIWLMVTVTRLSAHPINLI